MKIFLLPFLKNSHYFITLKEIVFSMEKIKQLRTVVHLELEGGRHYYFGNLKALCDNFDKETIGVGHAYLKNYGISEDNPFRNKYCIIRKGILLTSPKKME